jgi:hypothetical protein
VISPVFPKKPSAVFVTERYEWRAEKEGKQEEGEIWRRIQGLGKLDATEMQRLKGLGFFEMTSMFLHFVEFSN